MVSLSGHDHNIVASPIGVAHNGKTGSDSQSSVVFRSRINSKYYLGSTKLKDGVWDKPQNFTDEMGGDEAPEEVIAHCYSGVEDERLYFFLHAQHGAAEKSIYINIGDRGLWVRSALTAPKISFHQSTKLAATNITHKGVPMVLLYCVDTENHLTEFRRTLKNDKYEWTQVRVEGASTAGRGDLYYRGKIAVSSIGEDTCVVFVTDGGEYYARFLTRNDDGSPKWIADLLLDGMAGDGGVKAGKLSPLAITRAAERDHYFLFYIINDEGSYTIYRKIINPPNGAVGPTSDSFMRVKHISAKIAYIGATVGALPGSAIVFAIADQNNTSYLITHTQVAPPPLEKVVIEAKLVADLTEAQHKESEKAIPPLAFKLSDVNKEASDAEAAYIKAMAALETVTRKAFGAKARHATVLAEYRKAIAREKMAVEVSKEAVEKHRKLEDERADNAAKDKWSRFNSVKTEALVYVKENASTVVLPNKVVGKKGGN